MLATVALIARLVLSAVFAVAGAAKLVDRSGTRQAAVDFGAPARFAGPLAFALPVAELAVAALLVLPATAVAGSIGALALLALFTTAIAVSLAGGRAPDCHCFGQLHSAPASWKTLVRNGILAGIALVALAGSLAEPDASATAWIDDLGAARLVAIALGVTVAVLLVVGVAAVVSLLRSYGQVLVRLERVEAALEHAGIALGEADELPAVGLQPGTRAPAVTAASLSGDTVSLDELLTAGLPLLLLFTSPRCGPCKALLPKVAEWQRERVDRLTIALVSDGSRDGVRAEAEEHGLEHVLLDEDLRLYTAFEANGTPSAVLIAADGTIGSFVATGSDWIDLLVAQALEEPAPAQGLPVGAEAPSLDLLSLDGETVPLASFRGRDTVLLFWNPDCGFCRAMHEDLIGWERTANGRTPRLAVVSSGDRESTRAERFRSTVLLDRDFRAGSAFGVDGTPMAVLLGADGLIASPVSAGAEAVFALAQGRR